jgi:hypothetical protein
MNILALTLERIGRRLYSGYDVRSEIEWSYVEHSPSCESFLEVTFRVKAGGPGNSDPLVCQDIAMILGVEKKKTFEVAEDYDDRG